MSNLFWLTDAQMARLEPLFPKSHGRPRIDDRRVLSGIVFINRNGLRWCDSFREYGPPKTLYNRQERWSHMGVFTRIMTGVAAEAAGHLFSELIPYFLFQIDHASQARFNDRPFEKWNVWINVINVEADHGTTEAALFEFFYGAAQDSHTAGWLEMAVFSSCALRPLEWAGLLTETREDRAGKHVNHVFKTPLSRSALDLETDEML